MVMDAYCVLSVLYPNTIPLFQLTFHRPLNDDDDGHALYSNSFRFYILVWSCCRVLRDASFDRPCNTSRCLGCST